MFAGVWEGFDADEVPIASITNGVHADTWVAREFRDLIAGIAGPASVGEAAGWEAVAHVGDAEIWDTKRVLRERLVTDVRRRLRGSWYDEVPPSPSWAGSTRCWTPTCSRSGSPGGCRRTSV